MRSYGFAIPRRRKTVSFVPGYTSKSIGSAAANPGSEPNIPPISPSAIQANSSNVVGTAQRGPGEENAITIGKHEKPSKTKYKYKYKYPGDGKRKRDQEDGGADDMHMQQKALPGEQYRGGAAMRVPPYKKKPKIMMEERPEPRGHLEEMMQKSKAGDQYAKGASTSNQEKQKRYQTPPGVVESGLSYVDWFTQHADQLISMVNAVGGKEKLPPEFKSYYENLSNFISTAKTSSAAMKAAVPKFQEYMEKGKELVRKTNGMTPDIRTPIREAWQYTKGFFNTASQVSDKPGNFVVPPKGVGVKPGESSIPVANTQSVTEQEGQEPEQAYQGEEQKAAPGGDPNRTDPITPASGSKQTPATANSIVSVRQLKDAAERTAKILGPEAVHGNARERANMGKGALDTYEFQGPYDYPIYPGGRPDDTLTLMGAWRTDGGNDSSLWYSKKTAKGANAKRNKYFKYSVKGGGRWRKMTKDEMVNVFQKGGQSDNRFYGTRTGIKFRDYLGKTMSHKDRDVALARIGNAKVVESEHGDFSRGRNKYIGAGMVGKASRGQIPSVKKNGKQMQGPTQNPSENIVGFHEGANGEEEVDEFGDSFGQSKQIASVAREKGYAEQALDYINAAALMGAVPLVANGLQMGGVNDGGGPAM